MLLFCSASSVCKIDIKLYVISFFERYLTRTSIDPIPSFKIDKFIIFSYVPCLFVVRLTFLSIVISLLYRDLSFFYPVYIEIASYPNGLPIKCYIVRNVPRGLSRLLHSSPLENFRRYSQFKVHHRCR